MGSIPTIYLGRQELMIDASPQRDSRIADPNYLFMCSSYRRAEEADEEELVDPGLLKLIPDEWIEPLLFSGYNYVAVLRTRLTKKQEYQPKEYS